MSYLKAELKSKFSSSFVGSLLYGKIGQVIAPNTNPILSNLFGTDIKIKDRI